MCSNIENVFCVFIKGQQMIYMTQWLFSENVDVLSVTIFELLILAFIG